MNFGNGVVCDVSDDDGNWTQLKLNVRFPKTRNLELSVANALASKASCIRLCACCPTDTERRESVTSLSLKQHTARSGHHLVAVTARAILDWIEERYSLLAVPSARTVG